MSIVGSVYTVLLSRCSEDDYLSLPLAGGSEKNKFIVIDEKINPLRFTYHPDISTENKLASKPLKAGDILLQINDISVSGFTLKQAENLLVSLSHKVSCELKKIKLFLISPNVLPTRQPFLNSILNIIHPSDPFLRNLQLSIKANINCPIDAKSNFSERKIPPPPIRNSSICQFERRDSDSKSDTSIKYFMPFGWEKIVDPLYGVFYIDHVNKITQYKSPLILVRESFDLTLEKLNNLNYSFIHMLKSGCFCIKTVILKKSDQGFGFTLNGGYDCSEISFIKISKIFPGGVAHQSNELLVGDIVLSIDDKSPYDPRFYTKNTYESNHLINIFQNISIGQYLKLNVLQQSNSRYTNTGQLVSVTLNKTKEGFGFTLSDSKQGQIVKSVNSNNDLIKENDLLVQLNGKINLLKLCHLEVVELLKTFPINENATFLIARTKPQKVESDNFCETKKAENDSLTSNSMIYELDNIDQFTDMILSKNTKEDESHNYSDVINNNEDHAERFLSLNLNETYAIVGSKKKNQCDSDIFSKSIFHEKFYEKLKIFECKEKYSKLIKYIEENFRNLCLFETEIVFENANLDLGIVIEKCPENDKFLVIKRIIPGSVIERDGVLTRGDFILSINDYLLYDAELDDAKDIIKGINSSVRIKFLRPSEKMNLSPQIVEQSLDEDCYGDIDSAISTSNNINFSKHEINVPNEENESIYEVLNYNNSEPDSCSSSIKEDSVNNRRQVIITRDRNLNEGFGLVIVGASSINRPNVIGNSFIGQIIPGGAAERTGKLKVYDRVLMVNEIDVRNMTHEDIVKLIRETPSDSVKLIVENFASHSQSESTNIQRSPKPPSYYISNGITNELKHSFTNHNSQKESIIRFKVTLFSKNKTGFGFGVKWFISKLPYNQKIVPRLHISSIQTDGPASLDGRLKIFDQIVEINNLNLIEGEIKLKYVTEMLQNIQNSSQILHLTCQRKVILHTRTQPPHLIQKTSPYRPVPSFPNPVICPQSFAFANQNIPRTKTIIPVQPQKLIITERLKR